MRISRNSSYTQIGGAQQCDPYNSLNQVLCAEQLKRILTEYELKVDDITEQQLSLFCNAFVHRSYCTRKNENFINGNTKCPSGCLPLQEESNERLEFLGDAVLSLVIAKYLFQRYPDENEGFLTKLRTRFVNGNMLASLASKLNFEPHLMISKQIEESSGRSNKKILEDAFEAFLGAMFVSFGFDQTSKWIINMIEDQVDFAELLMLNTNYKDIILKYYQHNFNQHPKFEELQSDTHSFRVCLRHGSNVVAVGTGSNKKQAENECAKNALTYFGISAS